MRFDLKSGVCNGLNQEGTLRETRVILICFMYF